MAVEGALVGVLVPGPWVTVVTTTIVEGVTPPDGPDGVVKDVVVVVVVGDPLMVYARI